MRLSDYFFYLLPMFAFFYYSDFFTIEIYIILRIRIIMQKRLQFPRRAESLNVYKTPKSLQLPRFHSRPKNNLFSSKNLNGQDSEASSSRQDSQNEMKLTKVQMAQIVSRIKQKRYISKSKQKKLISQKKITACIKGEGQIEPKLKGQSKTGRNDLQVKGDHFKKQQYKQPEHRRQLTNTNQNNGRKFNEFRSKSLKNAIKYQQLQNNREGAKRQSQKVIKVEIKKKSSQQIARRKTVKEEEKLQQVHFNTQITTEATQPSNLASDIDKKIWRKITQIFLNITLDPDNLDWPEEYIVMDKQIIEKRLYQILEEAQHTTAKSKIRKHICISRVTIYLYSSLILTQNETKSVIPIFNRLHQSFSIATEIVSSGPAALSNDKVATISRNNQFTVKMLLKLLSKKSAPHQSLLKNMLQSSLKIQSIQFIEILDKTLKWQILKMPSYPYLPQSSKELYLVLDLDETLIHYDYNAEIFHVRPFAQQFLKKVSAFYQITIFTAALQQYADQILDQIDPQHCISYKLYRNHLTYIQGVPIKDLSMLGRPLNKTIIVDNISTNYRLQPQNGIQIRTWYDDDNDEVLGKLYGFLVKIAEDYKDDVRVGIRDLAEFVREEITKADLIYQLQKEL